MPACSNTCFDWGTFGGALRSGQVSAARYRYIVMVNSSVRGPFLPPYWPVRSADTRVRLELAADYRKSANLCRPAFEMSEPLVCNPHGWLRGDNRARML